MGVTGFHSKGPYDLYEHDNPPPAPHPGLMPGEVFLTNVGKRPLPYLAGPGFQERVDLYKAAADAVTERDAKIVGVGFLLLVFLISLVSAVRSLVLREAWDATSHALAALVVGAFTAAGWYALLGGLDDDDDDDDGDSGGGRDLEPHPLAEIGHGK